MTTTVSTQLPEPILEILKRYFPICTAYLIGSRSGSAVRWSAILENNAQYDAGYRHFDIVVFSTDTVPENARLAVDAVKETSAGQFSVTLMVHRPQQLQTHNPCLQWFFYNVLRDGRRLFLDTKNVPYLPGNGIPERDHALVLSYWLKCEAVAILYLDAANSPQLEVEVIKISLLHTVAEFICLGLIRIFLGYTPNSMGLKSLFALCGHFTNVPAQLFPIADESSHRRFKRLCAPPSMLRHWDRLDTPEADYLLLQSACKDFLEQAGKLARHRMQEISNQLH